MRDIFLWIYAIEWDCYRAFIHLLIWEASSAVTQLSCNLTGALKDMKIGVGGRDLGPGKVQTSNVLQNMECVESFPLGYVGVFFVLFRVGFIFFPAFSYLWLHGNKSL